MTEQKKDSSYITRRAFIAGTGATAVGLFFGLYTLNRSMKTVIDGYTSLDASKEDEKFAGLSPNVFIHIAPVTGLVSVVCHRTEMGQGIRSSLSVLLADELGADMAQVKVIQGEGNKAYGDQNTDGSSSVRGVYIRMRMIAATARMMLVTAAAKKLGVKEEELTGEGHYIVHSSSGRKLSFGELSIPASELPIPKPEQLILRPEAQLKHIGKNSPVLPVIDAPDYVSGKALYGADVSVPDMLIAVIARPPVLGGKVKTFDREAALKIPGVKHVVLLPYPKPPYGFQPFGGVAVLAQNTWAAMKGRDALQVTWDNPTEHASYNSSDYRKELVSAVSQTGAVERNVGDVEKALKESSRVIESEYYVPHLSHLTLEPPVALARFSKDAGGKCEIWASTQHPQAVQATVAGLLGIPEKNVLVHVTLLGGGFGRKSKADFSAEAAFLSKAVSAPVRVQWTRTDDIHNDYLNTVNAQRLTAGLDKTGRVVAWRHRTAFPPISTTFNPEAQTPSGGELQQGVLDVVLDIPNVRVEAGKAVQHARIGWLRSVYNIFHAFAVNSFVDEIAYERKKDPLENILEIFGPAKVHSLEELGIKELKNYGASLQDQPVDGARLQGVLKHIIRKSRWTERHQVKGKGFGLAVHRSFNSYAAVVASVVPSKNGEFPRVDEVWIALDAGKILNPDRVHAQLEGSVINGMSHLLYGGVTFKDGKVEQNNFDSALLVRNSVAPRKIHTEIIQNEHLHGGVGEPGVPPVAPAIANAVYALTGKRVREFNAIETFKRLK